MNNLPNSALLIATATTRADSTPLCTVVGEIDIQTAAIFRRALIDSLRDGEATLVDLSGVTFFGVAGIRALMVARDYARQRRGSLCISAPRCVNRVLEATGVAADFDLIASQ
ncbi:STAS domain-containing protein [Nocardia tengchongensis]|uniref:STAS domain-containing protein n=2 Tax=Nocardia tengchongensis TaxID=2055889 RepID=UPI0036BC1127